MHSLMIYDDSFGLYVGVIFNLLGCNPAVRFVAEWFLSMAGFFFFRFLIFSFLVFFFFFLGRQDFGVEIRVIYFRTRGFHSSKGSALVVLVKKASLRYAFWVRTAIIYDT
jgi:hypothetical protein